LTYSPIFRNKTSRAVLHFAGRYWSRQWPGIACATAS